MKRIEESLINFLKDDSLQVAVLKGEWGVGKTFFWRNFFLSNKGKLDFRAYSYVSLFGAQEINDLKHQIFSNFEMLDENKFSKHLEKLKPLSRILKAIEIPYLNTTESMNHLIESKLIDNFLICIDDLERKEETITGSSVLGFISQLKEEKSCKIILIYNDKELNTETEKQINEYREKVVDLELTYSPTIDENLSVIWSNSRPQCVKKVFDVLDLKNIRVMQRVKWTLEYFSEELDKYPELRNSFEEKCAMLTVIHHAYSKRLSIKEVLPTSYFSLLASEDKEKKRRFRVVEKLKYLPEEQDKMIADYLLNGYVDFTAHRGILSRKNEQYRLGDINESLKGLWGKYGSNFAVSQNEYIEENTRFLERHVEDLGVREVWSIVKFIRDLDPGIDLDNFLSKSIDLFVASIDSLSRHERFLFGEESELLEKIEEKLAKKSQHYSIPDLFVALAGSDGWNDSYIKYLLKYSSDDFFEWMRTEKSVDIIDLLKVFLRRFGDEGSDEKHIVAEIRVALEKISKRSEIDRFRVKYLIES